MESHLRWDSHTSIKYVNSVWQTWNMSCQFHSGLKLFIRVHSIFVKSTSITQEREKHKPRYVHEHSNVFLLLDTQPFEPPAMYWCSYLHPNVSIASILNSHLRVHDCDYSWQAPLTKKLFIFGYLKGILRQFFVYFQPLFCLEFSDWGGLMPIAAGPAT